MTCWAEGQLAPPLRLEQGDWIGKGPVSAGNRGHSGQPERPAPAAAPPPRPGTGCSAFVLSDRPVPHPPGSNAGLRPIARWRAPSPGPSLELGRGSDGSRLQIWAQPTPGAPQRCGNLSIQREKPGAERCRLHGPASDPAARLHPDLPTQGTAECRRGANRHTNVDRGGP